MNISVFGLGYVGAVTAACLARNGHSVVGVDVQGQKVEMFNQGLPPIVEPNLDALLRAGREQGRLRATSDCAEAVLGTELSLICVGTPSTVAGGLDLRYVRQVLLEIQCALAARPKPHVLVLRSTMLPGSTARLVREVSGGPAAGEPLAVYYYPEFLREGTAIADFDDPSLAVVGTEDGAAPPEGLKRALFGDRAVVVDWGTAELIKYACNSFHAAKITFANEMGRMARSLGIDARRVMELLCQDTRLNLSAYYLKPGNPFGGSCLPKDVRALTQLGRQQGLHLPLLESLLPSNERHLQALLARVAESGVTEVVILGLSFKPDTDDLRESAMVEVAQTLLGRGYTLRIYDPQLNLARLLGSNKRLIDARMPHLASLLKGSLAEAMGDRGLVIAAQRCVPAADLASHLTRGHRLLDVNSWPELRELGVPYEGFCW